MPETLKSFDDFLKALRSQESGVDPDLYSTYVQSGATTTYFKTSKPGVPERDTATGEFQKIKVTWDEYFTILGVGDLWKQAKATTDVLERAWLLERMQHASINLLGFVGYQVGETALIEAGYYVAEVDSKTGRRRFYSGDLPNSTFAHGVTEVEHKYVGGEETFLSTDHIRWAGKFTGRHGVTSLETLRTVDAQEFIVRDVLINNYTTIVSRIVEAGKDPRTILQERFDHGLKHGANTVEVTLSGLLAASWLIGATGTANIVLSGEISGHDETGTSAALYIDKFNGYQTQADDGRQKDYPVDRHTTRVVLGWQSLASVDFGATNHPTVLVLHEHPHDNPSVVDISRLTPPGGSEPGTRISYADVDDDTRRPVVKDGKITGGHVRITTHDGVPSYQYAPVENGQYLAFREGFVGRPTMTEDQFRTALKPVIGLQRYPLKWWDSPTTHEVDDFDPEIGVFLPAATDSGFIGFTNLSLVQHDDAAVLSVRPKSGKSGCVYKLHGVDVGKITAVNFHRILGDFGEIHHTDD